MRRGTGKTWRACPPGFFCLTCSFPHRLVIYNLKHFINTTHSFRCVHTVSLNFSSGPVCYSRGLCSHPHMGSRSFTSFLLAGPIDFCNGVISFLVFHRISEERKPPFAFFITPLNTDYRLRLTMNIPGSSRTSSIQKMSDFGACLNICWLTNNIIT